MFKNNIETTYGRYMDYENLSLGGRTVATGADEIDAELDASSISPQYVLANLGANDVSLGLPTEATWKADYQYILDAIHTKWPSAKIYMMRPWRQTYDTECNTLAGWIADLVAANSYCYTGPDERVFLENGDDGATYTRDGIHPNAAGYALTAAQWQSAIGY